MCRENNLSPECLSVNIKAGEGPLLGTKYKNKLNYKYIYLYKNKYIHKENCDGRDDIWKKTDWVTFQILEAVKGRMTSICNIWEIVIEHCRVILGTPDGVVPKNDTG